MVCGSLSRCDSEALAHEPGPLVGWRPGGYEMPGHILFERSCPGPCIAGSRDVKYHQPKACSGL